MNEEKQSDRGPIRAALQAQTYQAVPGEFVQIGFVVENPSDEPGEFSASIKRLPSSWVGDIEPIRLEPGERGEFNIRVQPPEETLGRYPFRLQLEPAAGDLGQIELEGSLHVAAYEAGGRIRMLMESLRYSVAPGGRIRLSLVLVNLGQEKDRIGIGIEGIPPSWVSSAALAADLEPGAEQPVTLVIQPPRSPKSRAGRHRIRIRAASEKRPDESTEVEAKLTVEAFSDFVLSVSPSHITVGDTINVRIENRGNTTEVFTVQTHDDSGELRIETLPLGPESQAEVVDLDPDSSHDWGLRIPAGQSGEISMVPRLTLMPLIGGERSWLLEIVVESTSGLTRESVRNITESSLLPNWALPVGAAALLMVLCLGLFAFLQRPIRNVIQGTETARAQLGPSQTVEAFQTLQAAGTQTAAAPLTQTADAGGTDADGDGLTLDQEIQLGTDPNNPDTDGDGLADGDEIVRGTSPTNADSDGDGLPDGLEVSLGLDPLNPDTDGDGLTDGAELEGGTDPTRADTDNDGLTDGEETAPCLDPLNPDTDGDGFIDGGDLDPCDAGNPSLTETAAAGAPTATPTQPPGTPTPTPSPQPGPTSTSGPPGVEDIGRILFVSDREGNGEIYLLDTEDGTLTRLTTNASPDSQPTISPDGTRIAFVASRDGNREIYIMTLDGTNQVNLTNHPADDRDPVWSPDGNLIAFTTDRDGNDEIYVMQTNGANPINFTNHPANDSEPDWYQTISAEPESAIAFTTDRDGNLEVYSLHTDGTDLVNLSNHPADDYSPAANPVDNLLAFVSDRDGNEEIYVTSLIPGATQSNLTANPAADRAPAWSPNGEWILFVTDRDGNEEIYVILVDDAIVKVNISGDPADDSDPDWIPP